MSAASTMRQAYVGRGTAKLEPVTSEVESLAILYRRAVAFDRSLEAAVMRSPQMSKAYHGYSLNAIAAGVMHTRPETLADIALTLAIAANWVGFVTDGLDEDTSNHEVGLAIASALENATLLLSKIDDLSIEGEALDLFNQLLSEIVRAGAEVGA